MRAAPGVNIPNHAVRTSFPCHKLERCDVRARMNAEERLGPQHDFEAMTSPQVISDLLSARQRFETPPELGSCSSIDRIERAGSDRRDDDGRI